MNSKKTATNTRSVGTPVKGVEGVPGKRIHVWLELDCPDVNEDPPEELEAAKRLAGTPAEHAGSKGGA